MADRGPASGTATLAGQQRRHSRAAHGRHTLRARPPPLHPCADRARDGASPDPRGELVEVNYEGTLINGEVFDSSYARGQSATFPSNRLIRGWVEALPLMRVGETWELYIPPDLGYGVRGTPGGPIGPNQALVFQLELVGLPEAENSEAGPADDAG